MEHAVRKKLRLEKYDYSRNGAYFVTVCTKNKQQYFWDFSHYVGGDAHSLSNRLKFLLQNKSDLPRGNVLLTTTLSAIKTNTSLIGSTSKTIRQIGRMTGYSALTQCKLKTNQIKLYKGELL